MGNYDCNDPTSMTTMMPTMTTTSMQPAMTPTMTTTMMPTMMIPTMMPTMTTTITAPTHYSRSWWSHKKHHHHEPEHDDSSSCCECIYPSPFRGCPTRNGRHCEQIICEQDRFCCMRQWDKVCSMKANAVCKGTEHEMPGCCHCVTPHRHSGCSANAECEQTVCSVDP